MSRMLLCETQEDLASAMMEYFTAHNFTVERESNGLRVLELLRDNNYDVIVLDVSLHGLDGIAVISDFRARGGSTPILLLSGKKCLQEMQRGLDAGADSYLERPFLLIDVTAQLRAMLRRPALRSEKILQLRNIEMDTLSGTVMKNDQPVHLHPFEFKLLQFLLRHPNQAFNARALFQRVWQKDTGHAEETVRTHVRTLRKKVDSIGNPSVITTVRGLGYKCEVA